MGRDYKKEAEYQNSPEQVKNRMARNRARALMERKGLVRKGDGKDVDHKQPLIKGGSDKASNLRVMSASANRSFKRTKNAKMA